MYCRNGWGYKDTEFNLKEDGDVYVGGTRYPVSGEDLPKFRQFWEDLVDLDMDLLSPPQPFAEMRNKIPAARTNERFMQALQRDPHNLPYKMISTDDETRLLHGHGHSCQEIFALRYGKFNRIPDLVIYPGEHSHVERLVKLVAEEFPNEVMIIPYGGGTTVSQALLCPENEERFIVSVDTQEMNRIKWIDHDNGLACIEAGATGIEIERRLAEHGVTMGMEPDSYEFSTLGGWIATRASGMMKVCCCCCFACRWEGNDAFSLLTPPRMVSSRQLHIRTHTEILKTWSSPASSSLPRDWSKSAAA